MIRTPFFARSRAACRFVRLRAANLLLGFGYALPLVGYVAAVAGLDGSA